MAINIPVTATEQHVPTAQRIAVWTLSWSAKITALYVGLRFVFALLEGASGSHIIFNFLNFLLLASMILLLIGLWGASQLKLANLNSAVRTGFSSGVVAALIWTILTILLVGTTTIGDGIDKDIFMAAWGWGIFVMTWFCGVISFGAGLFFVYALYQNRVLVDTTCLQLLAGVLAISINWLTISDIGLNFSAPIAFLALAAIGWGTGIGQLIVRIERGEDVVVSPIPKVY